MEHTPYYKFTQKIPTLINEYTEDIFLVDYLKNYLPAEILQTIEPDLTRFGKEVVSTIDQLGIACENNPPKLTQFNAWGDRIDHIYTCPEWSELRAISAREGLVTIGYERKEGIYSRLYQFVKLYLFTPSSAIYSCPLAMSDGAARLIEHFGDDFLKNEPFKGLTSRNPEQFKTSGQWMTERTGGSDVSRSMTLAKKNDDTYLLKGHKWFTSAITADMAFMLASTEQPQDGKRAPLSLFYLPIRNEDGTLNGIEVEALKDKMGTKALPTAQLHLTGAKAQMVGENGKGVKTISTLFNVTRIYNTISAVSYMRRAYSMSKAYGKVRETFGKKINQHLLFQKSLREMEIDYQSHSLLGFFLTQLLGKEDCKKATKEEEDLLRVLTPIAKLFTAKGAIKSTSEEIEMFGGLGYLEDTNIPVLHRNAQVLSIWEGTTNVLSLDMLRAFEKENGWEAFQYFIEQSLQKIVANKLQKQKTIISQKHTLLTQFFNQLQSKEEMIGCARDIAFYIAELSIAVLWLDFISKCPKDEYINALNYWITYKMKEEKLNAYFMM